MAVDVAGQHRGEGFRDRPAGNHIRVRAKYIVRRTDRGTLHGLMKTEKTKRRRNGSPSAAFHEILESVAHEVALAWETGHRNIDSADIQRDRAGTIDEVDAGMSGEKRIRNRRALVVSGHDDHRHSGVGNALERLEHPHHQSRLDAAPEEHVTAVNHHIDLTLKGRLQGELVGIEKILSPAMPIGARALGQIESEMRVGDEQDANRRSGHDGDRTGARGSYREMANVPRGLGAALYGSWSGERTIRAATIIDM